MSVQRWRTGLPDVDGVCQDGEQARPLLAVPPGAALPAQVGQVSEEGEAVPLLEVAYDGVPLLLALGPAAQEGVAGRGVCHVLAVSDVGWQTVLVTGGHHLLVLAFPGQHRARVVLVALLAFKARVVDAGGG